MNVQIERLKQLPQRPDERWQGDLFRSPSWVKEGQDSKPYRPWSAMWVHAVTGIAGMPVFEQREKRDFTLALDSLVHYAFDVKYGGYRPGTLEVRDTALGDYLKDVLSGSGIQVVCRNRLKSFDEALHNLADYLNQGKILPDALKAKGMTVDMMRHFADAAAEFYRARPWRYLSDVDLLWIESPTGDPLLRYASILGNARTTYGISFFDSPAMFEDFNSEEGIKAFLRQRYWALLFGGIEELPFGDADLWEDEQLPVASDQAYPLAICYDPQGRHRRPRPDTLALMEGLLRALAHTSEWEMDSGRWTKTVPTFQGEVTISLNLPDLLKDAGQTQEPRQKTSGIPDRRAMEKMQVDLQRILAGHDFSNIEEMQDFIDANINGKPIASQQPITPLEEAQDLCYEAFERRGRRRIQLARQALKLCPDCTDAYVILAESCSDVQEAHDFFVKGVEAGERLLGEKFFAAEAGHFWGILQTRPYMRARLGLAQTVEELGRPDEAIAHYQEMLRLNPNDNQCVRDLLLPCLLLRQRLDEAQTLWKAYKDDDSAIWNYGKALLTFLQKGDNPTARKYLRQALEANEIVPDYLLEEGPLPPIPSSYSLGSEEEAIISAFALRPAWQAHPEALRWLEQRCDA